VTDRFWGVKWVQELHEALANSLLLLVALHVAGVVFTSLRHGENLVRAMLTGRKQAPRPGDVD
jgi:cytochrome b